MRREEAASRAAISATRYARIEEGQARIPLRLLPKPADALGVPLAELLADVPSADSEFVWGKASDLEDLVACHYEQSAGVKECWKVTGRLLDGPAKKP